MKLPLIRISHHCCSLSLQNNRHTHGVDSTENEEVVYNRKFKFAFATNGIRSPAYPKANANPYRQNDYGEDWTTTLE